MKNLRASVLLLSVLALAGGLFFGAGEIVAEPGCPQGPDYDYISRSTKTCATIRFTCPEGSEPFFNDCGCGCKTL